MERGLSIVSRTEHICDQKELEIAFVAAQRSAFRRKPESSQVIA
jgi:hypothetical protein